MTATAIDLESFHPRLGAPQSELLERFLELRPQPLASSAAVAAIPWDPESRRSERLEIYRTRAGAAGRPELRGRLAA